MKNLLLLAVAVLFLGLTNTIYANGVTGQNLQDGLVAWYKFDGNANDSSGNNYHLTNVGAAKLVTGHKGDADGAYEFNGTSTSKLSADPAVVVRGDFSYSLWFQTSELMSSHGSSGTAWNPGNDIIHSGFKDYEYVGAGLRVGTDGLAVVEHGGMYRSTVFQYKKNIGASWHHVVVVVAAGRGEVVYLDGEYVGEAEINSLTLTSSHGNGVKAIHLDSDGVGGGNWGYYTGCIDDFRIYNRVLSAAEIKALNDGAADQEVTQGLFDSDWTAEGTLDIKSGVRQVSDEIMLTYDSSWVRNGASVALKSNGANIATVKGAGGYAWNAEPGAYVLEHQVLNAEGNPIGVPESVSVEFVKQLSVSFDLNGVAGEVAARTYNIGFSYGSLPIVATSMRPGYTFAGWFTAARGGAAVTAESVVSERVTRLYAHWTANSYTVRFNANGGEGTMGDLNCTYGTGKALTANAFTRTGYTFAGWAMSAGGAVMYADRASVTDVAASGTVTLYAKWTPIIYSVKFNANGGSGTMADESMTYDAGKALTVCAFTRTGYAFAGWETSANGEVVYGNGQSVKNLTATQGAVINFYAKWTANAYKVQFNANGGIGTMADEPFTYDAAAKALTACAFTRTGYDFAGWSMAARGAVEYADGASVKNLIDSGAVTLYAKWTPHTYTVDFNPGQGGEGSMSDQPMTYDEAEALYPNLFARTGYTFLGWTDDENEVTEVLFYDGVVVSNLTDEVDGEYDLYAVWAANEYTVRFNANGGSGTMAGQAFAYDAAQNLTMNGFTRAGCEFLGWAMSSAGEVVYADGASVKNLTATADGVVNLYAVWDVTGLVDPAETHVDVEQGEVAPYAAAATVYDGYLYDGGNVVGFVQVKVAKGKTDKKSGAFSAKVTATVQLADGSKKISFKNGVADGSGRVTGLTAAGHTLDISLGVDGMGGTMDGKPVDGARNLFSAKDADSKSIAAAIEKKWVGAVNVVGDDVVLSVAIAKKGKVKVSGTVEGAKVSATSQLLVGAEACCVPVVITKKANLAFNLWLMADGSVEVVGLDGAVAGKAEGLKAGAAFRMDGAAGVRALPGMYGEYLPNDVGVTQSGTKWVVADGAKAGKLALVKGTSEIDSAKSKFTENMSGLKLTYKAKDGSFKGSFKVYSLENGKIKAYTANVTGVMIGNTGYGTATIKKPFVSLSVAIE